MKYTQKRLEPENNFNKNRNEEVRRKSLLNSVG